MSSVPVFVGLDYHQDSVQVCVMDKTGSVLQNSSYENDADVIATVIERHGTSIHAAIEGGDHSGDAGDLIFFNRPRAAGHLGNKADGRRTKTNGQPCFRFVLNTANFEASWIHQYKAYPVSSGCVARLRNVAQTAPKERRLLATGGVRQRRTEPVEIDAEGYPAPEGRGAVDRNQKSLPFSILHRNYINIACKC